MPAYTGNTSGSYYGITMKEQSEMESFTLVNKTNGSITANLAIKRSSADYQIIPHDKVINVYEMYESDTPRILDNGDSLVLLVTGSCDYNFNFRK